MGFDFEWILGAEGDDLQDAYDSAVYEAYDAEEERYRREKKYEQQCRSKIRHYIECPFKEKEEAKSLGAKWDPERKKWYYTGLQNPALFKRWIPT